MNEMEKLPSPEEMRRLARELREQQELAEVDEVTEQVQLKKWIGEFHNVPQSAILEFKPRRSGKKSE